MPLFMYEGLNSDGKKVKGQINANTERDARQELRRMQIRAKKLKKPGLLEVDLGALFGMGGGSGRIKEKDLSLFTRQFATMVNAGVPIIQALDIQYAQAKNPAVKKVIGSVKDRISGGSTFWSALTEHKSTFSNLYVNMVKAGESGGILDLIMDRLSVYIEKSVKLKQMVKGAMMYPAIISVVGLGVIIGMLYFVIPKFQDMLESTGQELPLPTQIVIDLSNFFQNNILWILPLLVGSFIIFQKWTTSSGGRPIWHRIVLRTPIFGELAMKSAVARFSRTLSTLLTSGVSLIDALTISQAVLENAVYEVAIQKVKKAVSEGKTISEPLIQTKVFPDLAIQMITVGENTGELDNMLEKVADYYEDEVEVMVGSMSKLLEPFVLVFLGGMVGGILIAMYLPIFKLAGGESDF